MRISNPLFARRAWVGQHQRCRVRDVAAVPLPFSWPQYHPGVVLLTTSDAANALPFFFTGCNRGRPRESNPARAAVHERCSSRVCPAVWTRPSERCAHVEQEPALRSLVICNRWSVDRSRVPETSAWLQTNTYNSPRPSSCWGNCVLDHRIGLVMKQSTPIREKRKKEMVRAVRVDSWGATPCPC